MIQLDKKKKIIIAGLVVLAIIILLIFIIVKKSNKIDNSPVAPVPVNNNSQTLPVRIMTTEEKTDKVGIDPTQEAEVVNDQNGLYIYRIKK